jgi:hypothetical protein
VLTRNQRNLAGGPTVEESVNCRAYSRRTPQNDAFPRPLGRLRTGLNVAAAVALGVLGVWQAFSHATPTNAPCLEASIAERPVSSQIQRADFIDDIIDILKGGGNPPPPPPEGNGGSAQ